MALQQKIFFLVDDDSDDRELFKDALHDIDKSIIYHAAINGKQALELLNNSLATVPDVIFLDINMPEMNGWECLKALKQSRTLKHIPVIMYSTSSQQRERDIAADLGAIYFFPKPEKYTVLLNFLNYVADNISIDFDNKILEYNGSALTKQR
jgi:CheY-like chemotaxis protein